MLKKHGATVVEVNFNKESQVAAENPLMPHATRGTLEALPTVESLIPMSE